LLPVVATAASQLVQAEHGMVVTSHHLASEVGAEFMQRGGNAVDATVAVGYALAVTEPAAATSAVATLHCCIGRRGKTRSSIFVRRRPGAATVAMFLDADGSVKPKLSLVGYLAAGIPGSVLGLDTLLSQHGTLSRAIVMDPAIKLAEAGFVLDASDAEQMTESAAYFAAQPNVAAIFLNDGKPWRAGDRFVQKDLARALSLIAQSGPDAFYRGPIAQALVSASKAGGGPVHPTGFGHLRGERA
jgi:gamma-glutamyltranspeptidase/glutathione hydrolase